MTDTKQSSSQRLLVIRPDRLGDVILSTPSVLKLQRELPKAQVCFWIQPRWRVLFRNQPYQLWEMSTEASFGSLVKALRREAFDGVIHLQHHPKIAWATRFAGIKNRVGPLSRWDSRIVFNHGLRQRRSLVRKHEADYNIDLVDHFLESKGASPQSKIAPRVDFSKDLHQSSLHLIQSCGCTSKNFVLIHPGMGGSALNWPSKRYLELIERLHRDRISFLLSFGPGDVDQRIKSELQAALPFSLPMIEVHRSSGVEGLAGILSHARIVVAPSTGPLHLASALGVPVIGFFPKIRVQSAKRWGPYLPQAFSRVVSSNASVDEVYAILTSELRRETVASSTGVETAL